MSFARLLSAFALSATLVSADVRVVAPSGAPYTEIQAALDAANDGDVVLVRAGTYSSFVVSNQDVVVVADAGASVNVVGAIRVGGVSATRTVLLSGLSSTGSYTPQAVTRHGLFAQNCNGAVRVLDCQLRGVPLSTSSPVCGEGQGAQVENCVDVAFVRCSLAGSSAPGAPSFHNTTVPGAPTADGGHGLYGVSSTHTLYDSSFTGGRSGLGGYSGPTSCGVPPNGSGYGYLGLAGEGFRDSGAFVFASSVMFSGAAGWNSACWAQVCGCGCGSAGGNALVHGGAAGSAFRLDCTLSPGPGGVNRGFCPCGISVGSCAQTCCGAGQVSCSAPAGASVVGSVTALAGTARRSAAPRVVREGATASVTLSGVPGDRVELLVGERTARAWQPAARGVLLVKRAHPQLVQHVGTIGASGTLNVTWTVGALGPAEQARVLWMQAVMTDVAGQTTLSSPTALVVLDAAF